MMDAVELLRRLVELESPTGDAERIGHIGRFLAAELEALGARVALHGQHLTAQLGPGDGPPLVLVAHMDTVWPAGTLPSMPFRVEDGFAWGPGALDMKAGIVIALEALRAIDDLARSVRMLITADEEIGSPTGRPVVEEVATGARAVLVLEPPVKDGTITTSRSGLARYQLHIRGRAAHAGNGSRAGVSAIEELAHQITAVHRLSDPTRGIRTNVGQVGGGTGDNVVAGEAWARIDARAWTADEQRSLERAMHGLRPHLDGAVLSRLGRRHPAADGAVAGRRGARAGAIAIAADSGIDARRERLAGQARTATSRRRSAPRSSTASGPPGAAPMRSTSASRSSPIRERTALLAALLSRL